MTTCDYNVTHPKSFIGFHKCGCVTLAESVVHNLCTEPVSVHGECIPD